MSGNNAHVYTSIRLSKLTVQHCHVGHERENSQQDCHPRRKCKNNNQPGAGNTCLR